MNAEEYLNRMKIELKHLPASEQAAVIEEISAHLAEGQTDPRLGMEDGTRQQRLAAEMGAPEDLGRRLKEVHHPRRWLDYAMIVAPEIFVLPWITGLVSLLFPMPLDGTSITAWPGLVWGIRLFILFEAMLLGLSLWRERHGGSVGVVMYWLAATWLAIFGLVLRENRWLADSSFHQHWMGVVESIFWVAALVGLSAWLIRSLWLRRDPLWAALALLPFLFAVDNMATGQIIAAGGFPGGYNLPAWRIGWYFGPTQVAMLLWPALFFLFRRRWVQWTGLVVWAAPLALMNLIASLHYPHLAVLWTLPLVLVLAGWAIDYAGSLGNTHRKHTLVP